MRKQYYFRPSGKGYYAWDVGRLIELSAMMKPKSVPIDAITEIDENFWFEADGNVPVIRSIVEHMRLINEVDSKFPIILSASGRVMDGMHRIAKALLEGRDTIEAVQFTEDPAPDYVDVYPDELPY